jgi:hypothetical protein
MSARPWYREPMLALVFGLPAAAVVAGVATVVIAAQSSGDAGDPRVTRVAQVQTADLELDRAAARARLAAVATLGPDGVVTLAFAPGSWDGAAVRLSLRHATDAARDRELTLYRVTEGRYAGLLPDSRAAGAYNAELLPETPDWRLVGRLQDGAASVALAPALED